MLVLIGSTKASLGQTVTHIGCANEPDYETYSANGPAVSPYISAPLSSKISFYSDTATNSSTGMFGPSGWVCQASRLTAYSEFEAVPDAHHFTSPEVKVRDVPLVALQLFSSDSGIPGTVYFNALAASLFPKYFPGKLDEWIGGPMRSNGQQVTERKIGAYVPLGQNDVIIHVNDHAIEFITPPNTTGLGTTGGLMPSMFPTYGAVVIGSQIKDGPPLVAELFAVRLPAKLSFLREPLLKLAVQQMTGDLQNIDAGYQN